MNKKAVSDEKNLFPIENHYFKKLYSNGKE